MYNATLDGCSAWWVYLERSHGVLSWAWVYEAGRTTLQPDEIFIGTADDCAYWLRSKGILELETMSAVLRSAWEAPRLATVRGWL